MSTLIALRMPDDLVARLRAVASEPYGPSQTEIVRRGIELALAEYKAKRLGPRGKPGGRPAGK